MNRDLRTPYPLAIALLAAVSACTSEHGSPGLEGVETGTETGNAPLLMPSRVSIALVDDPLAAVGGGARVVGEPGATSPGALVEITALATGATYRATAAADGSFDVRVAETTGGFSITASLDGRSDEALITLGASAVATSALTCEQRSEMVRSELTSVIDGADLGCTTNADCTTVGPVSSCTSGCALTPVGAAGAAELEAAVQAVDRGACDAYLSVGCPAPLVDPCPAPQFLYCDRGTCATVPSELAASCALPFDAGTGDRPELVYWYDTASDTCLPRYYRGQGGNGNRATSRELCEAACVTEAACPPNRAPAKDVCTWAGGPLGECTVVQDVRCALICTTVADCADEETGWSCSAAGTCEEVGF